MNQSFSIQQLFILLFVSISVVIAIQFIDRQHQQNMSPYMTTPHENAVLDSPFNH